MLVDFWTYSCVNWLRTLPYIRAWEQTYRDRGFVLVGAHAPEFGFEHDLENVQRATHELGVGYPVVVDNGFDDLAVVREQLLAGRLPVDREGNVRFHHFGEGAYEETERAIQQLLGVPRKRRRVDTEGLTQAADWETLGSPETYLGSARSERAQPPG